jgi:hypothetical protein
MTTQTLAVESSPMLENRRFAVRFLGRPQMWLWLVGTLVLAVGAWAAFALPARGSASAARSWALWSGNVLLVLFLLTMAFVARKWSVKLAWFRDFGRAPAERADAAWAQVQDLNAKIRKGAFGSDAEILAAAQEVLARCGVEKIQRAEIATADVGGRVAKFVRLHKKDPFGRLEPWLEMHVGVGTIACLAVLLHADLALRHPIGWTLFLLSMVVLATGLLGAVLYRLVPERLAKADAGIPYEEAGIARTNTHVCIQGMLATLEPEVRGELMALATPAPTLEAHRARAAAIVANVAQRHPASTELARELLVMAGTRDELLRTTAKARRYDFWLRLWRWVHVPVSVVLFFVIALHVWAVLWY